MEAWWRRRGGAQGGEGVAETGRWGGRRRVADLGGEAGSELQQALAHDRGGGGEVALRLRQALGGGGHEALEEQRPEHRAHPGHRRAEQVERLGAHLAQQPRTHRVPPPRHLLRIGIGDGGLAHHEEHELLPALVLQVALRAKRAHQLRQREPRPALGLGLGAAQLGGAQLGQEQRDAGEQRRLEALQLAGQPRDQVAEHLHRAAAGVDRAGRALERLEQEGERLLGVELAEHLEAAQLLVVRAEGGGAVAIERRAEQRVERGEAALQQLLLIEEATKLARLRVRQRRPQRLRDGKPLRLLLLLERGEEAGDEPWHEGLHLLRGEQANHGGQRLGSGEAQRVIPQRQPLGEGVLER